MATATAELGADEAIKAAERNINEAISHFSREWLVWTRDDRGIAIDKDSPLADAIVMMIVSVNEHDWPRAMSPVCVTIGEISEHWSQYCARGILIGQAPQQALLSRIAKLLEQHAGLASPEKIAWQNIRILKTIEKCDDLTIAKICGCFEDGVWSGPFFDSHQRPMTHLIDQEINHPGTVLLADMPHPRDSLKARRLASQKRDIGQRAENRHTHQQEVSDRRKLISAKLAKLTDEQRTVAAVAYIRDEGGTVVQAAKAYGFSVPEVEAACSVAGTRPTTLNDIREDAKLPVESTAESTADTSSLHERIDAAIRACKEEFTREGKAIDPKAISDQVSQLLGTTVTRQKVTSMLFRGKRDNGGDGTDEGE